MKLAVIKGQSTNNVLSRFSDNLSLALNNLNIDCSLVDFTSDSQLALRSLLDQSFDYVISFNGMLSEAKVNIAGADKSLLEFVSGRFVAWFVDDTIYHLHRLTVMPKGTMIITPSEHHANICKSIGKRFVYSQLLAATEKITDRYRVPELVREFDVVFAGSWMGLPGKLGERISDPKQRKFIRELYTLLTRQDFPKLFDTYTRQLERLRSPKLELAEIYPHLVDLHYHVRKVRRIQSLESLARYPELRLAVIGEGWRDHLSGYKNVSFMEDVSHEQIKSHYSRGRYVLCPNTENGACERIFDSLGVGSVPIVEPSSHFAEGEQISSLLRVLRPSTSKSLVQEILLMRDAHMFALSSKRSENFAGEFCSWESRATQLLKILEEVDA